MSSGEKITGKVAQLVNERELAINRGSKHGVKEGMTFAVLGPHPIEVRDPDSDELLGTIDRVKIRVQATRVDPQMSTCKTYRTRMVGGEGLGFESILETLGKVTPRRRVYETLKASESSYPPTISPDDSIVSIGDRVVEFDDVLDEYPS